jgi:cation transport ATPase
VVDTAVFDKTGTLSESEARLVDFVTEPGTDRPTLRGEIAAIQTGSGHPIARAFRDPAERCAKEAGCCVGRIRQTPCCAGNGFTETAGGRGEQVLGGPGSEQGFGRGGQGVRDGGIRECFAEGFLRQGIQKCT